MTTTIEINKRHAERFHSGMKIKIILPDNSQQCGVVDNMSSGGMFVKLGSKGGHRLGKWL